jgi:hypothetical protein
MNKTNYPPSLSQSNFLNDAEKMADFEILTKEEFLTSYSYLTDSSQKLCKSMTTPGRR